MTKATAVFREEILVFILYMVLAFIHDHVKHIVAK